MRFVRSLPLAARREAQLSTCTLWGEGRSLEDHFAHQDEQLARATPELLTYAGLCDSDGTVQASLKAFSLSVAMRDPSVDGDPSAFTEVPTLGIGAVMVPEALRRRGLARRLIESAIDDAARRGCKLAWLFSEIDPTYYQRLGFVKAEWPVMACEVRALPRDATLEVRASSSTDEDLRAANAMDEARFVGSRNTLRPLSNLHRRKYFAWRNAVEMVWFHRRDGSRAGYISLSRSPEAPSSEARSDTLEVTDWAFANVSHDQRLGALRALADARGKSYVAGTLGVDSVDDRFARFSSDAHGVPMLRAIGREVRLPELNTLGELSAECVHFGLSDYF